MILVLDNHDSFTYNLVHLLEDAGSEVVVHPSDGLNLRDIGALAPAGILISPGPGHPRDAGRSMEVIRALGHEIPILGVCLGHQAIGEVFGGKTGHAPELMHGKTSTIRHDGQGVFKGLPQHFEATRYHSLAVDPASLPDILEPTAWASGGTLMGLRHRTLPIEGVQFHPESILTPDGPAMIRNWVLSLDAAETSPNPAIASPPRFPAAKPRLDLPALKTLKGSGGH